MSNYAANTTVPVERSRGEIERTLQRYGADSFMYGWSQDAAVVQFIADGRQIKFVLPLPDAKDPEFTHHARGKRTADAAQKLWEQACRSRWRALALCIKAKLEAVDSGISTFEAEFLAHTVLPDGSTVGEFIQPQIAQAYASGKMPSMLPALEAGS